MNFASHGAQSSFARINIMVRTQGRLASTALQYRNARMSEDHVSARFYCGVIYAYNHVVIQRSQQKDGIYGPYDHGCSATSGDHVTGRLSRVSFNVSLSQGLSLGEADRALGEVLSPRASNEIIAQSSGFSHRRVTMPLGQVTGIETRESSFSDTVKEAIKRAKYGQTVKITWSPEPEVSAKIAPLAAKSKAFAAILLAHREKTKYNGRAVNLTDAQQTDLLNAQKQTDMDAILIVRAEMNKEANKHRASATSYAQTLPNTVIKVGTETHVDPALCRFTFRVERKLTSVESADAIMASFMDAPKA